jgi:hypothetical protein
VDEDGEVILMCIFEGSTISFVLAVVRRERVGTGDDEDEDNPLTGI